MWIGVLECFIGIYGDFGLDKGEKVKRRRAVWEILMMKCKNYLRNGYGQFCKCYLGVLGVWSGTYGDVWLGNGRNLS